ncbi:hypothetical protein PO124_00605 [Bacillus licheniformis]|nr:hypothetical protein [Bacillus licheniformis]
MEQQPFLIKNPRSKPSRAVYLLAESLLHNGRTEMGETGPLSKIIFIPEEGQYIMIRVLVVDDSAL